MKKSHILIVDDEPDIRELISEILSDEGYQVSTAENGQTALQKVQEFTPDLVLLDIWMPDLDGVSLLKKWNESNSLLFPVVMMSGHGTIETAIEATKMGAKDFIEKPISLAKLLQTIEQTLTSFSQEKQAAGSQWQILEPIGSSQQVKQLREHLEKLVGNTSNTLLVGDSGTGKLTLAMLLHRKRHANNHVKVIDALSLEEQKLSADFEQAWQQLSNGGSIIISNVDCLTKDSQNTLLGSLKERQKSQGNKQIQIISTSQQDLKVLLQNGDFSRELYDCLAEITIPVCSLAERKDDVPELLNFYVNHLPDKEQTPYRKMSFAAQNQLRNYHWPGNLRELKNLVRQLQLLGGEGEIQAAEVIELIESSNQASKSTDQSLYDMALREAKENFERDYLLYNLKKVNGKVGELAKMVGMERTNLYRKLRSLAINVKNIPKS